MSPAVITPFEPPLPAAADAALRVVQRLRDTGCQALLNGGCVRDLLLGREPSDYDVATDAPPERIAALFKATRLVGAAFGVVLVRSGRSWIEVATFRHDGAYEDGRRPSSVRFTTAQEDAQRRDFTINGMFLDPVARQVIDYVGGQADLRAGLIRAIGDPPARFAEDHLRLLRAVRFAARMGYQIEPVTWGAIVAAAGMLPRVAAERIREELEKMFAHPTRARALALLAETGLVAHLWPGAAFSVEAIAERCALLERLPADARFELGLAVMLMDHAQGDVGRIARALACSNEQRDAVEWLVAHQSDLDRPEPIRLAALKRLMAQPHFTSLRQWAEARYAAAADGAARATALGQRLASISPEAVAPPPFVTGEDLLARGVPAGPTYKRVLEELYTRQLDEDLCSRDAALAALDRLLAQRSP